VIVIGNLPFAFTVGTSYFLFKVIWPRCKPLVDILDSGFLFRIGLVLDELSMHLPFDIIYSRLIQFLFILHKFSRIMNTTMVSDYFCINNGDIHVIHINHNRCSSYASWLRCIQFLSNNSIDLDVYLFRYRVLILYFYAILMTFYVIFF